MLVLYGVTQTDGLKQHIWPCNWWVWQEGIKLLLLFNLQSPSMRVIPNTMEASASTSVIFLSRILLFFWLQTMQRWENVSKESIVPPSSTFPSASIPGHWQGQGTGLDNLWPDPGWPQFLYVQVIAEASSRAHKYRCGSFERDWRGYGRLDPCTLSTKSRESKGLELPWGFLPAGQGDQVPTLNALVTFVG